MASFTQMKVAGSVIDSIALLLHRNFVAEQSDEDPAIELEHIGRPTVCDLPCNSTAKPSSLDSNSAMHRYEPLLIAGHEKNLLSRVPMRFRDDVRWQYGS
jgi:hypothetical protein